MCYNTSNNNIQIKELTQIQFDKSDGQEVISNISSLKIQILKAIETNSILTKDLETTYDLGDDQTARSLQQNIQLRVSYLRILGSLYSTVYDQQIVISMIIDQLMDSFRPNLILDNRGIKVSTKGLGLQVYKIGQKNFQSFIVQKLYDFEAIDLSNYIINRYIQLVKYKSNKYIYTEDFKRTFENGSLVLSKKETNTTIYEQSIIPFPESIMVDPQIFVDNVNQVTQVQQLLEGKLVFNMGVLLNTCNNNDSQSYDSTTNYNFICSSYINKQWVHESCQLELFTERNGQISLKCYCDQIKPISLMIMKISNKTKVLAPTEEKLINIEQNLNLVIEKNVTNYTILFISICLLFTALLYKIKKQRVKLNQIREQIISRRQGEPLGLTQQPRMSKQLYTTNIKYLHEISRLMNAKYIHLSLLARFLLTQTNINVLLTSIHVLEILLKDYFLSTVISIFAQLMFQIVVKVLEGFFNGPKALKFFGYFFIVSINLGLIAINIILNRAQEEHFIKVIQIAISLIILYGPLEYLIQYYKLSYAFVVSEELRLEPLNPLINFIYYFLQDEIVISLVQGATIY